MTKLRKWVRHACWVGVQAFGYVFGFPIVAPISRSLALAFLHASGFGNNHNHAFSGERWFVKKVLVREGITNCIDVGANVGGYSRMIAEEIKGQVYAIEPLSSSYRKLESSATARITTYQYAISDQDGEMEIYTSKDSWEGATLYKEILDVEAKPEKVASITLDTFYAKHGLSGIDFIKIDVQGSEQEVFRGMQEVLRTQPPKYIQFEYGDTTMRRGHTLYSLTLNLPGYEFYRLLPHGLVKIDPKNYFNNFYMFCNIIARRAH